MSSSRHDFARVVAASVLFASIAASSDPACAAGFDSRRIGQPGKDVMWVPTPEKAVERMLVMAQVGPGDFVIDLGSGDGRIVIMAAKRFGARGLGVDLNPELVTHSEERARQAGVHDRAKFDVRDIFQTDLGKATVVTLYLLNELNMRLRPTLLKLAPGTRIVAHAFHMGEWEADEFDNTTAAALRLWIVPAQIAGTWEWSLATAGRSRRLEMDVSQQFQRVGGVVSVGEKRWRLRNPRLRGNRIEFTVLEQQRAERGVRYDYAGRVHGDRIDGEVVIDEGADRLRWIATRKPQSTERTP